MHFSPSCGDQYLAGIRRPRPAVLRGQMAERIKVRAFPSWTNLPITSKAIENAMGSVQWATLLGLELRTIISQGRELPETHCAFGTLGLFSCAIIYCANKERFQGASAYRLAATTPATSSVFSLLSLSSKKPHTAVILMELVLLLHWEGCSVAPKPHTSRI